VDPSTGLVLQYDLKVSDGHTCGGAYLKFLTAVEGFQAEDLQDDTPYTVMFGPDKCGSTNKVRAHSWLSRWFVFSKARV
jgi:calnexin